MNVRSEIGESLNMNKKLNGNLRVAVVGAGYVAQHHLAALSTLDFVEIIGIADLDQSAAQALARRFKVSNTAAKLADLAQFDPNVVYVLTPPSTHAAIALEALDMGCHVLVEKPLAESVAECDQLIERARASGLTIGVNHSDRMDPAVLQALELVRNGVCGELVAVDFLRSSDYPAYAGGPLPAVVRQGSYPFRDLGVHGLYLLEAFLGAVDRLDVNFHGSGRNPNLRFDEWFASGTFERGVGRMQISWNVRPMQSRLIIQGTSAVIEVDRFMQIVRVSRNLPGPKLIGMLVSAWTTALKDVARVPRTVVRFATGRLKPSPGIRKGAIDFATSLREGNSPPASAEEGRHVIAVLSEAFERADRQRSSELDARFGALPDAEVLVTGAAGFLGRALVERLHAQGKRIRVLVRRPAKWLSQLSDVQIVVGDLGEPAIVDHALAGAAIVYHVGAAMKGSVRDFEAGTIWGTRNVIEACRKHGAQRLIYVSSLSVLDHAGRDPARHVTESSAYEPYPDRRGAYTQTKLEAEKMVLKAISEEGLPAVVIRPGQIFGPGSETVTPNGVISLAGRWIAVGPADMTIPLVYVDDVVDALLSASTAPGAVGQVINVVDPLEITQGTYLDACKRHHGPSLKVLRVPTSVFVMLGFGVELLGKMLKRSVPLTRYRVRSLRPLANFDLEQAQNLLSWNPRVGVMQGLERTFSGAKDART